MKNIPIYLFLFICSFAQAQSIELGATLGGMTYSGDLSPSTKLVSLNKIHPSAGLTFRYNLNDFFALRMNLAHGTISGDDALADTEKRRARNLHFKSNLQDLSAVVEFNILRFNPLIGRNFTVYALGGLGVFHFNPKALYQGDWVELYPLGTEGQWLTETHNPYRRWDISIPMGGGLKYAINGRWVIGVELRGNFTFNDYLDDVSTIYPDQGLLLEEMGVVAASLSDRKGELPNNDPNPSDGRVRGNDKYDDYYFTGSFTVSYRLINSKTQRKKMRQSRNQCPW